MEVAVEAKIFALAMRVVCCWYFDAPNIRGPGACSLTWGGVCLPKPSCVFLRIAVLAVDPSVSGGHGVAGDRHQEDLPLQSMGIKAIFHTLC